MRMTTYHSNFLTKPGSLRAWTPLLLVLLSMLGQPLILEAQTITTVAGNGTGGFAGDGGPATAASLNLPNAVAVDATGGILITDLLNQRIRRVAPDGTITTVAGNGTAGFTGDGGPATAARLNYPRGVAVDATGGILIADQSNHRIRRVAPGGTITTVAGNGTAGFAGDGGPALSANLNLPSGVTVDASGGILIADAFNHRIRRVAPDGTITTVAGNGTAGFAGDGGPATAARLWTPYAVAVDATGGILIADLNNHRIRRVAPDGTITTVAGNGTAGFAGDGGPATASRLQNPIGVAVDASGGILIADQENDRIRRVAPDGTIATVAGNGTRGFAGDGGPATAARLWTPKAVAVDASGGILIADQSNQRIRRVADPACATPTAFAVTGGGAYCVGGAGLVVGLAGSQTGISYQLRKDGSAIGSPLAGTGAALSFGPQAAGTYTVVASTTVGGCTADMAGSVTVTVNLLPDAGFSGLSVSYCANADAVTLTAASPGGTFGGPGVSGSTFTPANAGAGGSITYSVTVNGCTNSSSQNVTVNPQPDAGFSGLSASYCANADAVTLTPATPGGTFSGPGISGSTFTPANAGTGGSITYSVTVNGCTNSISQNVTVNPLPTASITGNGGAICAGSDASFTLSGTAGATLTYTITGQIGSQTLLLDGTSQAITASGATSNVTLTLVSVSLDGCSQNLSGSSTVTVKPQLTAGITGNGGAVCAGGDASFTVSGNSGATLTYTITGQNGNQTLLLNGTSQTVTASGATSNVTLTLVSVSMDGCTRNLSGSSTVTVNPQPTASISGNGGAICAGGTASFTISGTSGASLTYTITGQVGSQTLLLDGTNQTITANGATSNVMLMLVSVSLDGCTQNLSGSSTVSVKPQPTASISGNGGAICAGGVASFTVSGTSGATLTYTLTGQNGNQTLSLSGNSQTITASGETSNVTLTLVSVSLDGCSQNLSGSSTVTIKPQPTASISGNGGAVCAGGDASFTLSGTSGAALTYTITGQNGNQTLLLNGTSQTVTASGASGNVTLTLLSVSLDGCSQNLSGNSTVTVKPQPTASISGNGGAICAGSDASFTLSGTAGATLTYTITGQNGSQTLLLNGSSQTVTASGATSNVTLTLLSVSLDGCSQNLSGSSTVTVKPLPDASFTGLAGPYCANAAPVTLTPTVAGGTFSGTGISGTTFTPANAGTGGTIQYSVTVEGCTSTSQQNVAIKALPNASFSGLAGPYCADASTVTLAPNTAGGTFSGPGVSGSTFTPANAGSGGTIQYSVTVEGCTSSSQQNVAVKALPNASFTGLAGPYCADAAPLTLTPTVAGGTFTGPGVSGRTFTPANAGSGGTILYTVTVDGCSNNSSQGVSVRPAITLNTSPNTSVNYGYGSNCTTLTASASGGTGSLGLTWSTGATGNSVQVCPTQTTNYTVKATDAAGCSVSRQITVMVNDVRCGYGGVKMCLGGREACVAQYLVPTYLRFGYTLGGCGNSTTRIGYEPHGLEEPLKLSLTAYPNPVKDAVTVQVLSPTAGQGTFKVLDMNGVTRQTRTEQLSEGLNQIELRLGTLPTGVYLIRCVDAAGRQAVARVSKE